MQRLRAVCFPAPQPSRRTEGDTDTQSAPPSSDAQQYDVGPSGVGKSWLACALGHRACRDNLSVLYQRIPRLFSDLVLARGDGRYARLMRALGGAKLLILDDWGLEPLTAEQRHDMLEIVEDRYGRGATLITSQIPVDRWHDLIGDPTLADAILDRVVHNAHRIQLRGDSLRRKRAQENAMT